MEDLANGLIYYVVFLFSTTLHEAGHAWAAMRGGDLTAYHGGQVSLDPRPHIKREPFGMVILPLISVVASGWPFGFASAPYDPRWALRHPNRAAWMSLAGPGANLVLVALAIAAIKIGVGAGVFAAPDSIQFARIVIAAQPGVWDALAMLASVFFSMNLLLATFNLLPLPPLDGSAAVPLLLSDQAAVKYTEFLHNNRGLGFIGILVAWRIFNPIFHPIWLFAVNALSLGATYG